MPIVIGAALVDGSRDHGVAYVQDITARREAEARLRESEARFRNMAEHSPLILWMADADGRCVYVNQNWHDYSGVPPGGDLGGGFFGAVHPDDVDGQPGGVPRRGHVAHGLSPRIPRPAARRRLPPHDRQRVAALRTERRVPRH